MNVPVTGVGRRPRRARRRCLRAGSRCRRTGRAWRTGRTRPAAGGFLQQVPFLLVGALAPRARPAADRAGGTRGRRLAEQLLE
ncbi:MAG TPA: hypothetical protein VKF59_03640, partial [Candidatus Dormibacteraeota bacterium]|nr:hypothetical protein [Candidatus Dormibacteraeota bacterium]